MALAILLNGCAGNDLPVDAAPNDILAHAEGLLEDEEYFDAAELLDHFVRSYPGNSRLPAAKLRLGDARFGLEEYAAARAQYEGVVDDYPGSDLVEEARYKIGRCAYASVYPYNRDQTKTDQAIGLLEDFRRDYPDSRFLSDADGAIADCRERLAHREYEAGRFYEKQKRPRSAKIQYEFIIDTYTETEWAPKACFRIGELYRSRERWEDARRFYGRLVRDWPDSEEASLAEDVLESIDVAQVDRAGAGS